MGLKEVVEYMNLKWRVNKIKEKRVRYLCEICANQCGHKKNTKDIFICFDLPTKDRAGYTNIYGEVKGRKSCINFKDRKE